MPLPQADNRLYSVKSINSKKFLILTIKLTLQVTCHHTDNEKKELQFELRNQSSYVVPISSLKLGLPTKFCLQ
jgi:hypothetical protein